MPVASDNSEEPFFNWNRNDVVNMSQNIMFFDPKLDGHSSRSLPQLSATCYLTTICTWIPLHPRARQEFLEAAPRKGGHFRVTCR